MLTVNGRKASVELLKNIKINVEIRDFIDGQNIKKTYN
jgi:hypothetical protein